MAGRPAWYSSAKAAVIGSNSHAHWSCSSTRLCEAEIFLNRAGRVMPTAGRRDPLACFTGTSVILSTRPCSKNIARLKRVAYEKRYFLHNQTPSGRHKLVQPRVGCFRKRFDSPFPWARRARLEHSVRTTLFASWLGLVVRRYSLGVTATDLLNVVDRLVDGGTADPLRAKDHRLLISA